MLIDYLARNLREVGFIHLNTNTKSCKTTVLSQKKKMDKTFFNEDKLPLGVTGLCRICKRWFLQTLRPHLAPLKGIPAD